MKLKFILSEETSPDYRQNINRDQASDLIKQHCKETFLYAYEHKNYVYRGKINTGDYQVIDPKLRERKSRNTQNFYTLMVDNFPEWKAYPKRSRSLICSTSEEQAKFFGDTYVVFPFDGAKFGVCADDDMWDSFNKQLKINFPGVVDITHLNQIIGSILKNLGYGGVAMENLTFNEFVLALKKFPTIREELKVLYKKLNLNYKVLAINRLCSKDALNILKDTVNPVKNGFHLVKKYERLPFTAGKEIWTDSKVIMIDYGAFLTYGSNIYNWVNSNHINEI